MNWLRRRNSTAPLVATCSAGFWRTSHSRLFVAAIALFWPLAGAADEPPIAAREKGRIHGRFTDASTGKPIAGAKARVLVQGVPAKSAIVEALSDADGRYSLAVPLGHCNVWGVIAPAGFYTQDAKTYGAIVTTAAEPTVMRDFLLQSGALWQMELKGVNLPVDKSRFEALPGLKRQVFTSGEIISVTGDRQAKAVLTIPTGGGNYCFTGGLGHNPPKYEFSAANLEIDKGFDPTKIAGHPEPLADRAAVRLRDAGGRVAVIEGVEVAVESGRAVLRFQAKPIPTFSAVVFRGKAIDEADNPVAGAEFTAAFQFDRSGFMTDRKATTDAQGNFEMKDVLLPQSFFTTKASVKMIVVKQGLHGAVSKEMSLLEVKQNGGGDFGTVVLQRGRTLRGKVTDENGQPAHGAVVTNSTNYFLYSNLICRTDAMGQFVMPDLSFDKQKISAQYGERSGYRQFEFNAQSGECVITLRSPR